MLKVIPKTIFICVLIIVQCNASSWYRNEEMLSLYEAMTKISSHSIYSTKKRVSPNEIIKNYIHKIDEYGDYFTKDEYDAFKNMLSSEYFGVGMFLYQKKRNSEILCIPSPKLIKEGISQYDELISIDGKLVKGKNIYLVSSWIRGIKNSNVTLEVKKSSGKIKKITLKRVEQKFHSVQKVIQENTAMIRIVQFTSQTPNELRKILKQWPKNIPIIIDLRANAGGDFFAAINSVDLLLPKKTLISTMKTKIKSIEYYSSNPDILKGRKVYLLQDEYTASAAEMFIAALSQNNRAVSIGKKSLGKGVAQKFMPLENGDALLLTYGTIITPNKKIYHKIGLEPTENSPLKKFLKNLKE